jgi:dTDP-L-rhamnose 4-epimerase
MKVLVTGGAGFIGSHIVDALLARGHDVRVLDNLDPQVHDGHEPAYLDPAAEFVRGDIRDCYADITKIQTLGGYAPQVQFEQGIVELVEWCRTQDAEDRVLHATQELVEKGLTK